AYREIVAALTARKPGNPRMPGAPGGGYVLYDQAVAPYEKMRRDAQAAQALEPGVAAIVEPIQEQVDHFRAAKTPWRQADIVYDQQSGILAGRTFVMVG